MHEMIKQHSGVVVLSLFKEFGNKQNQSSAPLAKVLLFSA